MQTLILSNPQTLLSLLPKLHHPHQLHQLHVLLLKTCLSSLHPFLTLKLLASAALLDPFYAHSLLLHRLLPSPPPLFAFNSILRGLSLSSSPTSPLSLSFSLLNSLRRTFSLSPDSFSFIAALKSCSRSRSLPPGLQLHALSLKSEHYLFLNLRNALIHLYSSCGDILSARKVFDEMPLTTDAVSWSTLINGYSQTGGPDVAAELFCQMRRRGVDVNSTALVSLLSVDAVSVHGFCVKCGMRAHLTVVTAIVAMYARLRCLGEARMVFDEVMGRRDVVIYNCVVDGYAKGGYLEECLRLLGEMKGEGVRMNSSTLVGLLAACASAGALAVGRRVHEIARLENLEMDASLGTAILDMYVKCGCVNEAVEVFSRMKFRDVTAWTAMIMGLGVHGRVEDALTMFHEMEEGRVKPNDVTFLAVLNACSHGGMVGLGKELFKKMVMEYRMNPSIKHYGCIIDLFGRAGMLEEAYELIRNLPLEGDATAWRALLAACRMHGNFRLGNIARKALLDLGNRHPTDSILLSSTYAVSGKWEDVGRMRDMEVKETNVTERKEAGCSSIEMS